MSHRTWMYTINNYTEQEIIQLKAFTANMHRCCKEIGENGTPHLQGVITWTRTYRFGALKKLLPKAHWEPAKANDPENYCTKGEIIIDIKKNDQGQRTDLLDVAEAIKSGRSVREVAFNFPREYIKFNRGIEKLKFLVDQDNNDTWYDTEVIVIIGPSGIGKSRKVRELAGKNRIYNVPEPINGSLWFDGYNGETKILLDDFYGWIKYHTLLQFLDGYPFQIPCKGGFVNRKWTTVYITSNNEIESWYKNIPNIQALLRRITSVINYYNEDPFMDDPIGRDVTEVRGNTKPALCLI